jgi:hypothetical protein
MIVTVHCFHCFYSKKRAVQYLRVWRSLLGEAQTNISSRCFAVYFGVVLWCLLKCRAVSPCTYKLSSPFDVWDCLDQLLLQAFMLKHFGTIHDSTRASMSRIAASCVTMNRRIEDVVGQEFEDEQSSFVDRGHHTQSASRQKANRRHKHSHLTIGLKTKKVRKKHFLWIAFLIDCLCLAQTVNNKGCTWIVWSYHSVISKHPCSQTNDPTMTKLFMKFQSVKLFSYFMHRNVWYIW